MVTDYLSQHEVFDKDKEEGPLAPYSLKSQSKPERRSHFGGLRKKLEESESFIEGESLLREGLEGGDVDLEGGPSQDEEGTLGVGSETPGKFLKPPKKGAPKASSGSLMREKERLPPSGDAPDSPPSSGDAPSRDAVSSESERNAPLAYTVLGPQGLSAEDGEKAESGEKAEGGEKAATGGKSEAPKDESPKLKESKAELGGSRGGVRRGPALETKEEGLEPKTVVEEKVAPPEGKAKAKKQAAKRSAPLPKAKHKGLQELPNQSPQSLKAPPPSKNQSETLKDEDQKKKGAIVKGKSQEARSEVSKASSSISKAYDNTRAKTEKYFGDIEQLGKTQESEIAALSEEMLSGLASSHVDAKDALGDSIQSAIGSISARRKEAEGSIALHTHELKTQLRGILQDAKGSLSVIHQSGRDEISREVVDLFIDTMDENITATITAFQGKLRELEGIFKSERYPVANLRGQICLGKLPDYQEAMEANYNSINAEQKEALEEQREPILGSVDEVVKQFDVALDGSFSQAESSLATAHAEAMGQVKNASGVAIAVFQSIQEEREEALLLTEEAQEAQIEAQKEQIQGGLSESQGALAGSVLSAGDNMLSVSAAQASSMSEKSGSQPLNSAEAAGQLKDRLQSFAESADKQNKGNADRLQELSKEGQGQLDDLMAAQEESLKKAEEAQEQELEESSAHTIQDIEDSTAIFSETLLNISRSYRSQTEPIKASFEGSVEEALGSVPKSITSVGVGIREQQMPLFGEMLTNLLGTFVAAKEQLEAMAEPEVVKSIARVEHKIELVRKGVDGMGTDEAMVFEGCSQMNPYEVAVWKERYPQWESDLMGDLSAGELAQAYALLEGDNVKAALLALEDSVGFWNDDEARIEQAMRNLSEDEVKELQRLANEDSPEGRRAKAIIEKTQSALGGTDRDIFDALYDGNTVKADAISLYAAMDGWGTDEDKVYSLLEAADSPEKREALEKAFNAYSQEQVDKHFDAMQDHDCVHFSPEQLEEMKAQAKSKSDLSSWIDSEFSGTEHDLAKALQEGDKISASAARIELATEGIGAFLTGADEKAIFKELEDPDLSPPEELLDPPDLYSQDKDKREAAKLLQQETLRRRDEALSRREELKLQFESKYGRSIDQVIDKEIGAGSPGQGQGEACHGIDQVIDKEIGAGALPPGGAVLGNASGKMLEGPNYGRQVAKQYLDSGKVDAALAVRYSVYGAGTDEAFLEKTLAGKSKAEIAAMSESYAAQFGGANMVDDIMGDSSGKEKNDFRILLEGTPENPQDILKIAKMRRDFDLEKGGHINSTQAEEIEGNYQNLVALLGDSESFEGMSPEEMEAMDRYSFMLKSNSDSLDRLRESTANAVVTSLTTVAAVASTILTSGGAAPIWAGMLIAGGAAPIWTGMLITGGAGTLGILAKAGIKGNSYGWEELGGDVAMVLADVTTAGFGAYMSDSKKVKTYFGGLLKNVKDPVVRGMLQKGITGSVTGAFSGTLGTTFNPKTWEAGFSDGMGAVMLNGLTGLLQGGISGGGTGALGGWLGELPVTATFPQKMLRQFENILIEQFTASTIAHFQKVILQHDFGFEDTFKGFMTGVGKELLKAAITTGWPRPHQEDQSQDGKSQDRT